MTVRVQAEDFDVGAEIAALARAMPAIGAVASFIGMVRDLNEGDQVAEMTLEHYPGMTENALEKIVAEAKSPLGYLGRPGDPQGRDATAHRPDRAGGGDQRASRRSLPACEFLMDYLKTKAPFWKKEQTGQGARWVEARATDDAAADRWS